MLNDVTRWWWVRHAPVTSNDGRIYGQEDVPADCSDDDAFATLAKILPSGAVLATSDLQRTTQTADAIMTAGLDLPEAIVDTMNLQICVTTYSIGIGYLRLSNDHLSAKVSPM
jgi:alpha-ribazole phosphatase